MIPQRIIERKREGETLEPGALRAFLGGYLDGDVPEYQMAAFLMAVHFRGLGSEELDVLVEFMLHSGRVLDLSELPGPRVDKHSTGGVGDKVSLALAPLAAACGLFVPMMSGRGLGHTGGTLDKLESIPGFRTALDLDDFRRILESLGVAMIGQTEEIAPLDRRLYDLRSVTATVPSIPLIAASIMSKKLAEGLGGLVLDVKAGAGAFLPEPERALELGRTMVAIGEARDVRTVGLVTAMDRPLGRAVGNALEVREAVQCLRGGGPEDLREVVLALAAEMLRVGGLEQRTDAALARAESVLDGGHALERFLRLVDAQGGKAADVEDAGGLPSAPVTVEVAAPRAGSVSRVEPVPLGYGVVELGGGRTALGQRIDPAVGFEVAVRPGRTVEEGELLGVVHAADADGGEHGRRVLLGAVRIDESGESGGTPARELVSHRIHAGGVEAYG